MKPPSLNNVAKGSIGAVAHRQRRPEPTVTQLTAGIAGLDTALVIKFVTSEESIGQVNS